MSDWLKASLPDGAAVEPTARAFLRAGGRVSWPEWATLDADSRAALEAAGAALALEEAAAHALAARGGTAPADVLAPADGGAMRARVAVSELLEAAEKRL